MTGTRSSAALVVAVVTIALAVGPGVVAGAANPDSPCAGVADNRLVAYYDTDDRVGDATVYPGTTLTLYVCSGDEPEPYDTAWGFDAGEAQGIESVTERDSSVVVTVAAGVDGIDPASAVTQKSDLSGPTIGVQNGYSATTTVDGEPVTLQFASQSDLETYRSANEAFETRRSEATNASETLAAAAENGSALETDPEDQLATVEEANLTTAGQRLERATFAAAEAGDAQDARTVIDAVETKRSATQATTRENLNAYLSALERRGGNAAMTVRLVLGGALVGGLVVGAGVGYLLARRTLEKIEIDRGVSTATQYSPKQIAVPLALGVVALVVAAVGAVLGGGDLLAVIL
ncbi:hypothetical protein [Halobaculum magnesiiphilum]|uniref:Uncharacterized protein n=1 Tax=Halobaculum magnesiiphilum TaxID=1017351 RepID=A0A8T8WI44_9EURY|nr:hypothetical protein [Halobaculum magnesiiphilum]QZP39466.1 hypothetical protein K6T50_17950 [Halobaculum magnesiiphilum]